MPSGAHRPSDADLARPLGYRREHDIHDADPANQQRDTRDHHEQDVEHGPRPFRLLQQLLGDDNRIVFLLVVFLEQGLDDGCGFVHVVDLLDAHGDLAQLDHLTDEVKTYTAADALHDKIANTLSECLQRYVGIQVVVSGLKTAANRSRSHTRLGLTDHHVEFASHPDRLANRVFIGKEPLGRIVGQYDDLLTTVARREPSSPRYLQPIQIQVLLNAPFQLAWLPFVFSTARQTNAHEVFSRVLTYFILAALFVSLALSALAKEVLAIMATPEFHDAYKVIPLVALSYVVFGCYTIVSVGIYLESKTKFLAIIIGGAALINLALNFLLIPEYGMMGAAVATLISYVLTPIAAYLVSRRLYAVKYEWGRILKMATVAAVLYGTTILVDRTYGLFDSYWLVGTLKLVVVAIYPLALYLCGFFTAEEKQAIRHLLKTASASARRRLHR